LSDDGVRNRIEFRDGDLKYRRPHMALAERQFATAAGHGTHNTHEALSLGTRVIVLAKEPPGQGSAVRLDLSVPSPCRDEDSSRLVRGLEGASRNQPAEHNALEASPVATNAR